jgi:predicted N-acetyltransferase YhbS
MAMVTIRHERSGDIGTREALLNAAFGAHRFSKTAERLREQRAPAEGLSYVACEKGRVIGTVRLWHVTAGRGRHALLLGPLAVETTARKRGIGAALIQRAMSEARRLGHAAVLLVGDAPYYGRFGFSVEKTGGLWLPGPYERHRLLACELAPGALDGAQGLIAASKAPQAKRALAGLVARVGGGKRAAVPRVA